MVPDTEHGERRYWQGIPCAKQSTASVQARMHIISFPFDTAVHDSMWRMGKLYAITITRSRQGKRRG